MASSRDEQYPQLNPYRLPVELVDRKPPPRLDGVARGGANADGGGADRGGAVGGGGGAFPPAVAATSVAALAIAPCGRGTCSLVRQFGHSTHDPACDASADSFVRHTGQSKTIISPTV